MMGALIGGLIGWWPQIPNPKLETPDPKPQGDERYHHVAGVDASLYQDKGPRDTEGSRDDHEFVWRAKMKSFFKGAFLFLMSEVPLYSDALHLACVPRIHRRPYVGASHARSWSP